MIGVNGGRVFEGECLGCNPGDKLLTFKRCHSCGLSWLYEVLEGSKSVCLAKSTT